jgi:hypothetical protein
VATEAARVGVLALTLLLAPGCTTKVIDLTVSDGGAEKVVVPRADDADAVAVADAVADADDAAVADDAADAVAPLGFKEAVDAGTVLGPGHYVTFTCCPPADADAGACSESWLGTSDVCYDAGEWKSRAYERCTAAGLLLWDYRLFGAC